MQRAFRWLGVRARSEGELRTLMWRMARQGARREEAESVLTGGAQDAAELPPEPAAVIEAVLERLRQLGLVDDRAFAESWVEERQRLRPRSARALAHELAARGVDEATREEALEAVEDAQAALVAARRRVATLARSARGLDLEQRLRELLLRRGFSYEVAGDTARQVAREWEEEAG